MPCSLLAARLGLLLAAHLLSPVLRVLLSAAAGAALVLPDARALQTVLRLELLGLVDVVVDEAEAGAAATAKSSLESEQLDAVVVVHLVHLRQLLRQIRLGDVGNARVDNVEDELLAAQQRILLELAGADRELRHRRAGADGRRRGRGTR